jgi:hypothetical protein
MNNWYICRFFSHILLGILIFKGLTARRLCKSFGVKGLTCIPLNFGCSHNSPPYVTRLHTAALKCHFPYFLSTSGLRAFWRHLLQDFAYQHELWVCTLRKKSIETKMAHSESKTRIFIIKLHTFMTWATLLVAQLVETLCCKPEDHGFDSRWCHWNFLLT